MKVKKKSKTPGPQLAPGTSDREALHDHVDAMWDQMEFAERVLGLLRERYPRIRWEDDEFLIDVSHWTIHICGLVDSDRWHAAAYYYCGDSHHEADSELTVEENPYQMAWKIVSLVEQFSYWTQVFGKGKACKEVAA